jgi:putative ABC transport system permease protein
VTGVYAMLAFSVEERRRELAVRLALGAHTRDIVGLVLRAGMAHAVLGVAVGSVAAIAFTRVLRSLLYEVAPTDGWTFTAAAALLLGAAAIACYLPARRAGRLDPLTILRE